MRIRALGMIAAAALIAAALGACTKTETAQNTTQATATQQTTTTQAATTAAATAPASTTAAPADLKIEDIKVGTGAVAEPGKLVTVHYTGTLMNGKKFDSSLDRGQPFQFHLGAGEVIQGWDKGVVGMRVGGQRKLIIPPSMAYGERGAGGVIPPNATLAFDIQLLAVQ